MTLILELTPDMEGALAQEARRQGTTPERLALDGLRRLYGAPHAAPAPKAPDAEDPTLALFARWDAEDETDDPQELERRRRDTDDLLASLQAHPLTLRRVDLLDETISDREDAA